MKKLSERHRGPEAVAFREAKRRGLFQATFSGMAPAFSKVKKLILTSRNISNKLNSNHKKARH